MKRDLKKWLKSGEALTFAGYKDGANPNEYSVCCEILKQGKGSANLDEDSIIQFIWCAAQKQFLKDTLDDIDDGIEKIFRGKDNIKNDKARIVAEEANLKAWLHGKYHYLKRKNGK